MSIDLLCDWGERMQVTPLRLQVGRVYNQPMYQDTYIEYWGEIFVSARIIEFGITFERFLKDPWKHLMSCGQESAPDAIAEGMLPLLPAQAEVARRVRESEQRALISTESDKGVSHRGNIVVPLVRVAH